MDDMAKKLPGFVLRDNGYWYYRARVPKDLLRFCKEKEKWIALGTTDREEAEPVFHLVAANKLKEYAELRKQYAAFLGEQRIAAKPVRELIVDRDEAILLAKAFLSECLSTPESRKTAREWGGAADDIRGEASSELGDLRDQGDRDDGRFLVQSAARGLLQRGGYDLSPLQPVHSDFLGLVRRTLIAIRTIELKRLDDDFSDDPGDADLADFKSTTFSPNKARFQALTVERAIEKLWAEEIGPEHKAQKTIVKYKAAHDLLARFLGKDTLIRDVTREQVVEYRNTLEKMPSNYSKRFAADISIPKLLEIGESAGLPRMSFKTREAYMSLMKRLFRWASANDHVRKDISLGLKIGGKRIPGRKKRRPFEIAELNTIFKAPVFTGCLNDGRDFATPGPNKPKRSRYWLPLIALFTGMRMGEILQLRVGHVRTTPRGKPFLYLTDGFGEDDGDEDFIGMELKTFNSRREVPVHPILVATGFLTFVEDIRRAGGDELFPEVQKAADGKKSSIFSKRFSRFLHKAGVKPDGHGNCFHMFRHSLRDVIRDCGISGEIADAVQGWAREEDEGRNYGLGYRADAIADVWSQLEYEGFEYRHLITEDETKTRYPPDTTN
jgi:integrase